MAGRKRSSYVKEYGAKEGKDVHSRMQKISGLKSAHARKMKKLRKPASAPQPCAPRPRSRPFPGGPRMRAPWPAACSAVARTLGAEARGGGELWLRLWPRTDPLPSPPGLRRVKPSFPVRQLGARLRGLLAQAEERRSKCGHSGAPGIRPSRSAPSR